MALILCERQQNWLSVVTVVSKLLRFFNVFLRFFENPKSRDFLRFFAVLSTFSRTMPRLLWNYLRNIPTYVITISQRHGRTDGRTDWIGLSSVLRPRQHSIGYMGDGFYRSKDPTNSIKVLKVYIQNTEKSNIQYSNNKHKTQEIPLVYTNMGWLGDGSHRRQGR